MKNFTSSKTLKAEFILDSSLTYFNHGSFGATPRKVFNKYQWWQRQLEKNPTAFLGRNAAHFLQEARVCLADFLGTVPENLIFVTNATTGVNMVAHSLHLGRGDEVLASDHEYGAMENTWRFLSKQKGFEYTSQTICLPVTTSEALIDDLWQRVTNQTRVIYLSHITSSTAMIFPIADICRLARQKGIFTIIDGAHAPGQLELNLEEIGADFYVGNLHKWLCAPKGSGFLFARKEVQHLLEPLIVSWGWQVDDPNSRLFIDRFEWQGTRDLAAFLTVPEAIDFQKDHNWREIVQQCHALASELRQCIIRHTGIPCLYPDTPEWYAQMGTAPLPAVLDLEKLNEKLTDNYRLEIPVIKWKNMNLIRFSVQAYNSIEDVDKLDAALKRLL